MTLTATPELCPNCQISLATEADETPWCERCEWNLDCFRPDPNVGRLGQLLDQWANRVGFRQNRATFEALASRPIRRPKFGTATLVLFGITLLLTVLLLGSIAGGLYLVIYGSRIAKILGALIIGLAVLVGPRLTHVRSIRQDRDEVSRDDAPHFFALLDRVAKEIGVPGPDHLFFGAEWTAFTQVYGLRSRRALMIGLPFWVSLRRQEQVFLLGHMLYHFSSRDILNCLLTEPACTAFGKLSSLVQPGRATRGAALFRPLQWGLCYLFFIIHIGILRVAARGVHHAEYYADAQAAEMAGKEAITFLEVLDDSFRPLVGGRARDNHGFADWKTAVEERRLAQTQQQARRRQLSLRWGASPRCDHPPYGLRHRMLSTSPYVGPKIVLTEEEAKQIDAELAKYEKSHRQIVAHSW